MKEIVLNVIKMFMKYCIVTLNILIKKNFWWKQKKSYLCDRFSVSNRNFTTEHVKTVRIPGFLYKVQGFSSFFQTSYIPGFSR